MITQERRTLSALAIVAFVCALTALLLCGCMLL